MSAGRSLPQTGDCQAQSTLANGCKQQQASDQGVSVSKQKCIALSIVHEAAAARLCSVKTAYLSVA